MEDKVEKLELSKETLLSIEDVDLADVRGGLGMDGAGTDNSATCYSLVLCY